MLPQVGHQWFKKLDEAWRECGLVQKDFSIVVSAVSQLLGPDLFSYLSAHEDDLALPSKHLYRFDDGQLAYYCSLGEKFVGPVILLVIKKITPSPLIAKTPWIRKLIRIHMCIYIYIQGEREIGPTFLLGVGGVS